jgi:hypothetical protein
MLSQKHRKKIEKAFSWAKTVGGMAQTRFRGVERVRSRFILTMAANNLARLPRLLTARRGRTPSGPCVESTEKHGDQITQT